MTLETKATLLLDNQIHYKQTVSTYFIKYKCKNLGKKILNVQLNWIYDKIK